MAISTTLGRLETSEANICFGPPKALHNAAARGHVALAKVLLAERADPAIRNAQGQTALDVARARFGTAPALEAALTQDAWP